MHPIFNSVRPGEVIQRIKLLGQADAGCGQCGAKKQHQKKRSDDWWDWLGVGETERCSSCGADHEYWTEKGKRPLAEHPTLNLIALAREVEWAYTDISRSMTAEQIALNRGYLRRILQAILSSNIDHIPDRVEKNAAEKYSDELREQATDLYQEVYGSHMAKNFYTDEARQLNDRQLNELISELQDVLAKASPTET